MDAAFAALVELESSSGLEVEASEPEVALVVVAALLTSLPLEQAAKADAKQSAARNCRFNRKPFAGWTFPDRVIPG